MTIQRKRVAKRLASGLLAGAMALGGLAISGASPVSANAPTTARYSGLDRYSTSVEIARAIGSGHSAVVIASGQDGNLADALGASALNTPILLANSDGIPASVANYLSNPGNVAANATFVIVGGTSAVGASAEAELAALGFAAANITRIAGTDRYDTAIKVSQLSGVTGNNDQIIIASGENDHLIDAVAAATLSAEKGWPVLLAGPNGLSDATQARLKAILTTPGVTIPTIHILGGTSAVSADVEAQLTSAAVGYKASKINRIAGATRYATAALVATVIDALAGFDGETMLLNGTNPVDALVAGPLGAANDWIPALTPGSSLGADAQAQIVKAASLATNDVTAIGGTSAIATSVLTAASDAAKAGSDVAPVFTVVENASSFTVKFTGKTAIEDSNLDCTGAGSFDASFRIGGQLNTSYAGNSVSGTVSGAGNTVCTVTVSRTAAFTAGTVIEFLGVAEGSAGGSALRSFLPGSTTVADDNVKPTFEIAGIRQVAKVANTSDGYTLIYVKPSETVDAFVANDIKVYKASDAADGTLSTDVCENDQVDGVTGVANAGGYIVYSCSDGATDTNNDGDFFTDDGDDDVLNIETGDVIVISASAVADASGNANAAAQFTVALDATKPVVTATSTVGQGTAGVFAIETGATDVTLTVTAKSAMAGHLANGWRIVLENSASTVPAASVDTSTKRVTLSFNFATHDGNDILWAVGRNAAVAALGTWAGGSTGKVAGYISGDMVSTTTAGGTLGTSTLAISLTSDSPLLSTANVSAGTGATCNPTTTAASAGGTTFSVACAEIASGAAAPVGPIVLGATKDLSGNDATGAIVAVS